ncbi:MAG: carbohydrate ABC transporter permease, partial [Firmicutes bacterium]|nr:carbohydrate ABC transporter permease [Bacillota bacterium]
MSTRLHKSYWLRTTLIFLLLILFLVPFYLIVNNSFRTTETFVRAPFTLTNNLDLKNYADAFTKMRFLSGFQNSLIVTIISVSVLLLT